MDYPDMFPADFKHLPPAKKRQFLDANADETKHNELIVKQIDDNQRQAFKERYVENQIKLAIMKDKKKAMMDEHEERMKPHKEAVKNLESVLRNGVEEIETDVFLFRDHENERVYTVLPSGEIVDDRRMLPHERQSTIQGSMRSVK